MVPEYRSRLADTRHHMRSYELLVWVALRVRAYELLRRKLNLHNYMY